MDRMKTAVIDNRVSTIEQAEGGASLKTQEQACLKWRESRDYKGLKVLADAVQSAKTADRPELPALMAWAGKAKPRKSASFGKLTVGRGTRPTTLSHRPRWQSTVPGW